MTISDLTNNLPNILKAPTLIKQMLIGLVFLLTTGVGFLIDNNAQITDLSNLQTETQTLKTSYLTQIQKINHTKQTLSQFSEIKSELQALRTTLPKEVDLANQLKEITKIGVEDGLQFLLFKPNSASVKEFYIETPISITVSGNYAEILHFNDGFSTLTQMTTINNIHIASKDNSGILMMSAIIINYSDISTTSLLSDVVTSGIP